MSYVEHGNTPTYCSVDDVAEILDFPSPDDPFGMFRFSDMSHPSYSRVEKMILSAEDEIDRRTRRSWRVNYVKEHVASIQSYWHDTNGVRMSYFRQGGDYVQLHKDILPWDPDEGDKLEIRTHGNQWRDITDINIDGVSPAEAQNINTWFDHPMGKLYIRTRLYQVKPNALRISYRWGSTEPVPAAINELAYLTVASQVLASDMYNIKMGLGGDVAGIKDQVLRKWAERIGYLYTSYQRPGSVHAMW